MNVKVDDFGVLPVTVRPKAYKAVRVFLGERSERTFKTVREAKQWGWLCEKLTVTPIYPSYKEVQARECKKRGLPIPTDEGVRVRAVTE